MTTERTPEPDRSEPGDDTGSRYGRAGDRVTVALRTMIADGQLAPGEHLRQDELAARLSSTRVPIREAFKTLAAEGVLTHRPNHGHFVAKVTSAELAEICWLRDVGESRLADTVAWPGDDAVVELRRRNDAMRALVGQPPADIVAADRRFHEGFWGLSPLRVIEQETARMWTLITPYRSFMDYGREVVSRMHAEHDTIVGALAARDQRAYRTAVRAHQRHIYAVVDDLAAREALPDGGS